MRLEAVDAAEIAWIAGVDRQAVRESCGSNHGVVRAGCPLAPASPKRRGNLAERSGRSRVEGDRVKVSLGLLQMCLTSSPLLIGSGDEWADGEFGQSHGGDERLGGQQGGIGQPRQQDDGRSVQDAARLVGCRHLMRLSKISSRSLRQAAGSMAGKWLHWARSASAESFEAMYGRRSATGFPPRVIVTRSPRATRSMTSPPWLRSSRTVTSLTAAV
jgi:hypothetical protein